jgi:predicted O-methyltransferase YrrM
MLSSFRLIARTIVTGKPMPYSGLDLINRVLAASGRAPVPAPTWRGWIKDLKDDTDMADAYERARPTLAKHRTPSTYPLSWSDRVDRTSHLVDVFYGLMRALRPNSVIETGVAYGMTSSLMLAAFQHNQSGKLLSIDLPNRGQLRMEGDDTGILVANSHRERWELVLTDSVYELPARMKDKTIDVFVHDSAHTYANMAYEYCLAAMHLPTNGIIISDDILWNSAFTNIMRGLKYKTFSHGKSHNLGISVVARPAPKPVS